MIDTICKEFQIPSSCKIDKKLYKKHFLENFSLRADEKKFIKEDIENITLLYLLNKNNINIEPKTNDKVDYSEVAYIHVKLTNDKHYKKVSSLIQQIPYMVVLILTYEDNFCINTSTKRINQNDTTKLVIEEEYFTKWIDINHLSHIEEQFLKSLNLQSQSFVNFERFYHDILNKVVALNLSNDRETLITLTPTSKESLDTIMILEEKIKELKAKIKKETHFNEKVNLNIELKRVQDKLDKIVVSL